MLKDRLVEALVTDSDYTMREEKRIIKAYENYSPEVKETINLLFIDLCGYSLRTLLKETSDDSTN